MSKCGNVRITKRSNVANVINLYKRAEPVFQGWFTWETFYPLKMHVKVLVNWKAARRIEPIVSKFPLNLTLMNSFPVSTVLICLVNPKFSKFERILAFRIKRETHVSGNRNCAVCVFTSSRVFRRIVVRRPVSESHLGALTRQGGQHMYVGRFGRGGSTSPFSIRERGHVL